MWTFFATFINLVSGHGSQCALSNIVFEREKKLEQTFNAH